MAGICIYKQPDGSIAIGDERHETEEESRAFVEGDTDQEKEGGYEFIAFLPYGDGEDQLMRLFEEIMDLTWSLSPNKKARGHLIDLFLLKIFEGRRQFGKSEK